MKCMRVLRNLSARRRGCKCCVCEEASDLTNTKHRTHMRVVPVRRKCNKEKESSSYPVTEGKPLSLTLAFSDRVTKADPRLQ